MCVCVYIYICIYVCIECTLYISVNKCKVISNIMLTLMYTICL